jgi:excisionase family DNA binding protein
VISLTLPDELVIALADEVAKRVQNQPMGWFNVASAARYLDTTEEAIRSLVKRNAIPAHRVNGRVLFSPAELDTYVRGRAA